jgi:hypothetical protein
LYLYNILQSDIYQYQCTALVYLTLTEWNDNHFDPTGLEDI